MLNNKHKQTVTIFISNMTEDVWSFVNSFNDYKMKTHEIQENARLSDQHFHSVCNEKDLILVTPYNLEADFTAYIQSLYKFQYLETFSPQKHTGETCADLLKDHNLYQKIFQIAKEYKAVVLKSYSSTRQFYKLKKQLIADGLTVNAPEAPAEESAWTVNFFGSKSGIRQLAQMTTIEEPDFRVADGLICTGVIDASQIAAHKYIKNHGVVLKTNKGHSGAGVLIFRETDLPQSYEACQKKIESILREDNYWSYFPIVIEDLVNVNLKVGGGFPNAEYLIKGNGEIELLYFGGLIVTKDGVFKGMEIGKDVINDRILASIIDFGYFIGEQFSKSGYRGYYDVDIMAARNGKLYVSESNTRRTGSTHVYESLFKLLGKDFLDNYFIITHNAHQRLSSAKPLNFGQLLSEVEDLLYQKGKTSGVILTSANILQQNSVGYIIFAAQEKQAKSLMAEFSQRLSLLI